MPFMGNNGVHIYIYIYIYYIHNILQNRSMLLLFGLQHIAFNPRGTGFPELRTPTPRRCNQGRMRLGRLVSQPESLVKDLLSCCKLCSLGIKEYSTFKLFKNVSRANMLGKRSGGKTCARGRLPFTHPCRCVNQRSPTQTKQTKSVLTGFGQWNPARIPPSL